MAGDASDYGMRACFGKVVVRRTSYVVRRANQNELKTHTESHNKSKTHPERGTDTQSSVPHAMEATNQKITKAEP